MENSHDSVGNMKFSENHVRQAQQVLWCQLRKRLFFHYECFQIAI